MTPTQITGTLIMETARGAAFSLCALITLGNLFFVRIKRSVLFPLISGAALGAAELFVVVYGDRNLTIPLWGLYMLHTAAAFLLLCGKDKRTLLPLICAEIFSASLMNGIQTAVFSAAKGNDGTYLTLTLLYIAGFALSVGFVLLMKLLMRGDDREPMSRHTMLLLTVMTYSVTRIVTNSFTMSEFVPDVSAEAAIPSALLLMSVTALLLLSAKSSQTKHFKELSEMSEQFMSVQARHFEQTREADREMRMLRHDMKNHIAVMTGLYDSGDMDGLGRYLRDMGGAFADTQAVNITGCEIADAVIAEKKSLAESRGIRLVTDGSLKGLSIHAVTLCTILSNLLDNATEAAEALPDPVISITARRSGSFYYIRITNPAPRLVDTAADITTTKPDGTGHGLGLKSVRRAAEKCGGTLELTSREAPGGYLFEAEVILPATS